MKVKYFLSLMLFFLSGCDQRDLISTKLFSPSSSSLQVRSPGVLSLFESLRQSSSCMIEIQWSPEHFWLINKTSTDLQKYTESHFVTEEEQQKLTLFIEQIQDCQPILTSPTDPSLTWFIDEIINIWQDQQEAYQSLIERRVTWNEFNNRSQKNTHRLSSLVSVLGSKDL